MTYQTSPAPSGAEFAAMFLPMLIAMAIGIGINILICFLIYQAQQAIPPEHRRIEPGMVWLLLIPLFNLVWNFWVFLKVPESYQSYFHSRGRTDVGDAGKSLGLWFSILVIGTIIPCLGLFAGLAALVLLILFLVKITGLKNQVLSGAAGSAGFPWLVGHRRPRLRRNIDCHNRLLPLWQPHDRCFASAATLTVAIGLSVTRQDCRKR